ncbi:PAS domain S-box protein [Haloterrigena sp. SYSU A121-1]|uniref:histidine kinase n=1 Tax=Haloterrigena gelatinilytica TaxID=2741724 RepID=A0A8J8GPU8_9EURY|nr:PAS domain S-box protein [Haloterrigena gelatinilytica]NUB92259.1 PAS domain S-box protein [Haloterrigena gelatinilytica]
MGDTVRILLVDDDPSLAELAATVLEREDDRFSVETVAGAGEGLAFLADHEVDCVVSDYDMPGRDGIAFLEAVRADYPDLPFLLFTGKGSEAVASEAISAGVTDYLRKESTTSQYAVLANRIGNAVEQYRARRAIEDAERKLSRIAENTNDVLFLFDGDWSELLFVNSAYEAIWGRPIDTLREDSRSFLDAVHPDDRERVRRSMERLSNGAEDEMEYRVIRPDGERRWVRAETKPVFDGETVSRIVGFVRDITDRKRRERELERTSDLLEKTERIADVGGWELDTDTRDVFWTDHLFELLGYDEVPSLEEALSVYHEDDRPAVERAVEAALDYGDSFDMEVRARRPDGEIRWLRVQGVPTVEDGTVVTLRGAVQDITDRKERERDLEQARAEYEELINGMNDTAWVIGPDHTFLTVNDAAVETLGYSKAELRSMRPHDIDAGLDDEEITALIEGMPEDEVQVFETVHETKSGETFPVEISSSIISYRGETAVLCIGRDISSRKEREEQLAEFASVASHDLRNPLTIAQGRLELAREDCDSDHLDEVERAHRRMSALITDLLSLANDGERIGETEPVDLDAFARCCWDHVVTAEATLVVDLDRTIRADRSRLRQLFENLMRNAIEHGGADVTVAVGGFEDGFFVEDDGDGITETQRERALESGYSTVEDGTGFGLSIVEQVADAHGWDVRVTEGADGGARFEITGLERAD